MQKSGLTQGLKYLTRRVSSEEGVEILEAALVLPLLFMFLMGIVWFGRAFNIYSAITQAAQQGAIFTARARCATCSPGPSTFPSDQEVADSVIAVLKAANLDETQIILDPMPSPLSCTGGDESPCTSHKKIAICRNVLLNPNAGNSQPPQCGTLVAFHYPFQSVVPLTMLNGNQIVLSAQAQSRLEQ